MPFPVFLESWESSKKLGKGFSETLNIDLDARELSWLIADLALEMQRRGLVLAKRWWIEQRIEQTVSQRVGLDFESAKDATARILRFISHRTGLLEERALDLYAFSHRTLQEYFAAVGAINESDLGSSPALPKLIRPYLFHPDWVEVVRLISSQLTPPRAEELVRIMLDDPDPSGRFLHRGPLLALRCLLDGTTIANRELADQVFRSFASLGRSQWLGITLEAISLLNQLRLTRYEGRALATIARILDEAQRELDSKDYATLALASNDSAGALELRGFCGLEPDSSAVIELTFSAGDIRRKAYVSNAELISNDRDAWHDRAVAILDSPKADLEAKQAVISQMGILARLSSRSRVRLKRILRSSREGELRVAAARALRRCTSGRGSARTILLSVLQSDDEARVRAAAAFALADLADRDECVRQTLANILNGGCDEDVQVAALQALSDAAVRFPSISSQLLTIAENAGSIRLQVAAVRGLDQVLKHRGDVLDHFRRWAVGDDARTRAACQVLAEAFSDGTIRDWDAELIARVECVLRNLGTPECDYGPPCPHALWALESLVDAREAHSGIRTEAVLAECLTPFFERLHWAFVFGSVARNEQSDGSDIDLMLIGDVTMREVSASIKRAEQLLGRNVNPAIYSRATFTQKLHAGDPFLVEVMRASKIPLRSRDKAVNAEEFADELRELEAERLAGS